ncbi:MAG: hypothetical protein GXO64_00195 [Candidatus Micrarchaeota archaeon]|nr:hypothetical protein [Candidatus Micrarchaeota archaeon]
MMSPYLVGLLFGDGTSNFGKKNKAYAVWIDQHERNSKIAEKAKSEFENIGLNVHYYTYLNKVRAMVYSKSIFHEFNEIRKEPVKYFKSLGKKKKFEFISGFFDAEGIVTDRLVLYNGNKKLLEAIKVFLELSIEVTGHVYRYGKIHGLQIYRRSDIKKFILKTNSIKIKNSVRSSQLRNVGEC